MKVISIPNNNWKLPSEVKDGEICIVREWPDRFNSPIGKLLQRYTDKFIILGEHSDNSYPYLVDSINIKVEILPKGTIIEL